MELGFEDAVEIFGGADGDEGVGVGEGGEDTDFVGVFECWRESQYTFVVSRSVVGVHARTAMIAGVACVLIDVDSESRLGDVNDQMIV